MEAPARVAQQTFHQPTNQPTHDKRTPKQTNKQTNKQTKKPAPWPVTIPQYRLCMVAHQTKPNQTKPKEQWCYCQGGGEISSVVMLREHDATIFYRRVPSQRFLSVTLLSSPPRGEGTPPGVPVCSFRLVSYRPIRCAPRRKRTPKQTNKQT